jgi:choline dehydrogenase
MRGQARDYDHWADLTGDARWRWDRLLAVFQAARRPLRRRQRPARCRRCAQPRCCSTTSTVYGETLRHHNAGGEWRVEQPASALGRAGRLCPSRRSKRAFRPPTTSTAATTKAWAISKSTRNRVGAGTRPRPSCAPPVTRGPTSNSGPRPRWPSWCWTHRCRRPAALHRRAGVDGHGDGRPSQPHARSMLSAGSIGSPQILQLSGIGPGSLAASSTALNPCIDLPGVGANLQDHLQIRSVFKVQGRQDAQHAGQQLVGQGQDRAGICCSSAAAP